MKEQSKRVLPTITIANIEFYVDAYHSVLIEKGNPDNQLHSLEMMRFEDHYEFVLDTNSRGVYEGQWIGPLPQEAEYVWIRPFPMTDPVGMDLLLKDRNGKWSDNDKELPVIKIKGHDFYVDDLRRSFREVDNRWNLISFKEVEKKEDRYGFYFDSRVKNVAFPHEIEALNIAGSSLSRHIEFVQVPSGHELSTMLREHKLKAYGNRSEESPGQSPVKRKGKKI